MLKKSLLCLPLALMANSAFAIEAGQYVVTVGGQYSWAGTPTVNGFNIANNACPATGCPTYAETTNTVTPTNAVSLPGTSKLNLGGGYLGVGYGVADSWTVGVEFGMQTNKTFFDLQSLSQAQITAINTQARSAGNAPFITYNENGTNTMNFSGGFTTLVGDTAAPITAVYSSLQMKMKSNYQVLLKGGYTYYFSDSIGGFASLGLGWGTSKLDISGTVQATNPAQNPLPNAISYSKSRSNVKGMLESGLIWKATDMFRVTGSIFVENRVKPKAFSFSVINNPATNATPPVQTGVGYTAVGTGFSNKVGYGLRLGVGFVF